MSITLPSLSRGIWRTIVCVAVLFAVIMTAYRTSFHHKLYQSSHLDSPTFAKPVVGSSYSRPSHQFWHDTFILMNENKPNLGDDESGAIKYTDSIKDGIKTKQHLLEKAEVSSEIIADIKTKHANVLKELPKLNLDVTYKSKTNGIVLVGGGKYSWLAYLSILSIRDTGSKLPIEVIMPRYKDYEKELEFCTTILPQLNAACVVVPDVLGPSVMLTWSKKLATYQFKSLALMVSTFQNVLLVDADNIMLKNPDSFFESQLFKENGMITWPDYWQRVTSPLFYDVAGVTVDELSRVRYNRLPLSSPIVLETAEDKAKVPYHDLEGAIPDISTESGQLLINKATHAKTLLLSMYYNMYGPTVYYKLLSLGEPGEGDKDTFPAAAHVTKQKFYQVKSNIKTHGYFDDKHEYQGVSMGQHDPLLDYSKFKANVLDEAVSNPKSITEEVEYLKTSLKEDFNEDSIPLFTLHCNFPKLDPITLMDKPELYDSEQQVLKYRMYSGFKYFKKTVKDGKIIEVEEDFELQQWKRMKVAICDRKYDFPHLEEKYTKEEMCNLINNQISQLSE